jgi:hypothetical protein
VEANKRRAGIMCENRNLHIFQKLDESVNCQLRGKHATDAEWCLATGKVRTSRLSADGNRLIQEDWTSVYNHKLNKLVSPFDGFTEDSMTTLPALSKDEVHNVSNYFRVDSKNGITEAVNFGIQNCHWPKYGEFSWDNIRRSLLYLIIHKGDRWADTKYGPYRLRVLIQQGLNAMGKSVNLTDIKPVEISTCHYEKKEKALLPLKEWFCDSCDKVVGPEEGVIHIYHLASDPEDMKASYDDTACHHKLLCTRCSRDWFVACQQYPKRNIRVGELSVEHMFGTKLTEIQMAAFGRLMSSIAADEFTRTVNSVCWKEQDVEKRALANQKFVADWVNFMYRFTIPHYEEARKYFDDPLVLYRYNDCTEWLFHYPPALADIINTCIGTDIDTHALGEQYARDKEV